MSLAIKRVHLFPNIDRAVAMPQLLFWPFLVDIFIFSQGSLRDVTPSLSLTEMKKSTIYFKYFSTEKNIQYHIIKKKLEMVYRLQKFI